MKKNTSKKNVTDKEKTTVKKSSSSNRKKDFFVVGMGASAGGLEALNQFFDNMPSTEEMAFVVVQHLDPTHKSILSELLARHTKMKVAEATDGVKVKAGCIYTIPPNKDLKIFNGVLQVSNPTETRASRRAIDSFFRSLAEDQKDKAVGIILSGTGTEGTLGLKEIKGEGGITFVQEPHSAQFDGMPLSAITAKTADYILTPNNIPASLLLYFKRKNLSKIGVITELTAPLINQLQKIFQLIRTKTGYDFSNYKTNTIVRRLTKRCAINQIDSIEDYITLLQNNPAEVEAVYKDFLIGVTSFFRDKDVFKSIEQKVIPHLLKNCLGKQELRIWVCGCSTGEEAYSLAILCREALEKRKEYLKVMIFASDIDKEAIEFARNGIYPDNIRANVSDERLARYFVQRENVYQLKREIREMIVFAHHNIIKDPPFSKMDLITCRNVLIYMNTDLQKKVLPIFHYSLNENGILCLGTSESVGEYTDLFSDLDPKNKIFLKRKNSAVRKPSSDYELPTVTDKPTSPSFMQTFSTKKKNNISGLTEKILLENYAPPSVIIDKQDDVVYFSGRTGQYLEMPTGEVRLNIFSMAKKGLKSNLETAIKKVRSDRTEVRMNGVEIQVNSHFQTVNLIVKPIATKAADFGTLMVIFENAEKASKVKSKRNEKLAGATSKKTDLEKELQITRDHLQAAINELKTSNEDLQSTNEEYQSSNEELQSTNEELETSREELQSVNEELITVNNELQGKIEQLSQANDDLTNLLRSIEVATLFLDRNLKIKRFTPAATKIFNIITTDIDRPVTHLSNNLLYKALEVDVKNVLKTLSIKSADVHTTDGTWYHMRILPYRSAENVIEGVLVTFVDISEQKQVEESLKKTNEHLNLILENLPAVPYTCVADNEIKITFIGKSCEKVTGFLPEQFTDKTSFWINRIHPNDKKSTLSAFKSVVQKGSCDQPFRWKCANGKYKHFTNYLRYAIAENGRRAYIVGVWQEMPENNKQLKEKK